MPSAWKPPDMQDNRPSRRSRRKHAGLTVFEMVIFAMLGAMMFATTYVLQAFPNIHLLGLFIVALTVVYRWRALYPLYVFVCLHGIYLGFTPSWVPYLYIWTVLWGAVMLLPKSMPPPVAAAVYPLVSGLHGCLFGILYAPAQALLFGLDFEGMLAWIAVGVPYDITHGISNLCSGVLILPLVTLLRRLDKNLKK